MRISDWSSDVCPSDLTMTHAIDGDLVFGHRFEQGALRARRCAVDFVGKQQLGENRAGMEHEALLALIEHADPEDVRWQQVGGELQALEIQAKACRHRPRQRGFAKPRSEEHTSELQSLMRSSYAVFCLKKKKTKQSHSHTTTTTTRI